MGKVAVIDGDTKEVLAHIPTGYAVHVLKASEHHSITEPENPGRFWYTMGRDGKMTKIDLWQNPENMLVAEVTIAYDARDVAVSGDGKYVIGGAYWPPHFAIVDAETMEPREGRLDPRCERRRRVCRRKPAWPPSTPPRTSRLGSSR